eukprot:227243-Chlamydomonas_euryale.AAC.8
MLLLLLPLLLLRLMPMLLMLLMLLLMAPHIAATGYKGSSDLFIDSNAQLSLAAAKSLAAKGKRVHVVMPDHGEYVRTYKMYVQGVGPGKRVGGSKGTSSSHRGARMHVWIDVWSAE